MSDVANNAEAALKAASDEVKARFEEQARMLRHRRDSAREMVASTERELADLRSTERAALNDATAAALREFRRELEEAIFGRRTPPQPKLDKLWDLAWSNGHSEGLESVYSHYDELSSLVTVED